MESLGGVNAARGEAAVMLGGRQARLCLTLGALAEIETALGLGERQTLAERLKTVTARDVTALLEALLRGGGADPADAARLASGATPEEAARAVAAGFAAAARG
jgi:hypothetical protein